MIRFEFYSRREQWIGSAHLAAWEMRMQQLGFGTSTSTYGELVFYSILASDYNSAKALAEQVYAETKTALHQNGAVELKFR